MIRLHFIFIFSILPFLAHADILRIETNNWEVRRPLTWSAEMVNFDQNSGLITFSYLNQGNRISFNVHHTRVYSISFDANSVVDREFPSTRQDLSSSVKPIPRNEETIYLHNDGFLSVQIPKTIIVRPDRNSKEIRLRGGLLSLTQSEMLIEALTIKGNEESFTIPLGAVLLWTRGK